MSIKCLHSALPSVQQKVALVIVRWLLDGAWREFPLAEDEVKSQLSNLKRSWYLWLLVYFYYKVRKRNISFCHNFAGVHQNVKGRSSKGVKFSWNREENAERGSHSYPSVKIGCLQGSGNAHVFWDLVCDRRFTSPSSLFLSRLWGKGNLPKVLS